MNRRQFLKKVEVGLVGLGGVFLTSKVSFPGIAHKDRRRLQTVLVTEGGLGAWKLQADKPKLDPKLLEFYGVPPVDLESSSRRCPREQETSGWLVADTSRVTQAFASSLIITDSEDSEDPLVGQPLPSALELLGGNPFRGDFSTASAGCCCFFHWVELGMVH